MRNRRYLSLRVKLLKRQFGLPGDVLSLKSLSLASSSTSRQQQDSKDRFSYSGVHHVSDGHSAAVSRLVFAPGGERDVLVSASADGAISICDLKDPTETGSSKILRGHSAAVLDLDLSQGGELAVSCSIDGSIVLWDLSSSSSGSVLRRVVPSGSSHPTFCRFLPQNNNLVVCGSSASSSSSATARVFNVSTGKVDPHQSCPLLGRSLCAELGQRGAVLWVGNDRSHVESVRVACGEHGVSLQKGCRINVCEVGEPSSSSSSRHRNGVTSLSFRAAPRTADKPLLLAAHGAESIRLFSVVDDFGTLEAIVNVGAGASAGTGTGVLMASVFAPLLCGATSCAAAGVDDGSVVLLDLQRRSSSSSSSEEEVSSPSSLLSSCVANKLMAHSKPVIALAFSPREDFLASADSSGQIIIWKK